MKPSKKHLGKQRALLAQQFNPNWANTITTTSTAAWPTTTLQSQLQSAPSPRKRTALEWLDDRIAEVCKEGALL